ncbi:MAG: hypothetical protein ACT4NP_17180 [Pseudonocardiales bacterium]
MALRAEEAELRAELDGYADDAAEGKIDRVFAAKVVGNSMPESPTYSAGSRLRSHHRRWPACWPVTPVRTCPPAGAVPRSRRAGRCCGC